MSTSEYYERLREDTREDLKPFDGEKMERVFNGVFGSHRSDPDNNISGHVAAAQAYLTTSGGQEHLLGFWRDVDTGCIKAICELMQIVQKASGRDDDDKRRALTALRTQMEWALQELSEYSHRIWVMARTYSRIEETKPRV